MSVHREYEQMTDCRYCHKYVIDDQTAEMDPDTHEIFHPACKEKADYKMRGFNIDNCRGEVQRYIKELEVDIKYLRELVNIMAKNNKDLRERTERVEDKCRTLCDNCLKLGYETCGGKYDL